MEEKDINNALTAQPNIFEVIIWTVIIISFAIVLVKLINSIAKHCQIKLENAARKEKDEYELRRHKELMALKHTQELDLINQKKTNESEALRQKNEHELALNKQKHEQDLVFKKMDLA
jgi:ABC-type multidrug transport system fused ATPase/permease subunit